MPDINIDVSFPEHRKVKRTVGLLGRGSDVLPIRLWLYCGRQHPDDGKLIGYSEQEIESVCDWWGEKGKMVEVFLAVVWLERIENGFQVHDWLEHQGHLMAYKKRASEAAKVRWSKLNHATSIQQAMLGPPLSNAKNRIVEQSTEPITEGECEGKESPELIYAEYPRKVARKDALRAISKALASVEFKDLLAKTQAYARAVAGMDPQYIPHPATWFNRESYNDNPLEWNPKRNGATATDHANGF